MLAVQRVYIYLVWSYKLCVQIFFRFLCVAWNQPRIKFLFDMTNGKSCSLFCLNFIFYIFRWYIIIQPYHFFPMPMYIFLLDFFTNHFSFHSNPCLPFQIGLLGYLIWFYYQKASLLHYIRHSTLSSSSLQRSDQEKKNEQKIFVPVAGLNCTCSWIISENMSKETNFKFTFNK